MALPYQGCNSVPEGEQCLICAFKNAAYLAGMKRAADIVRTFENNWTRINEEIAAIEKELADADRP